jgi:hypothetical protein
MVMDRFDFSPLFRSTIWLEPHLKDDVYHKMKKVLPAMHEPIAQAVGHAGVIPAHREEIRATLKLRLGKRGRLNATFRTTPAGLVTVGIMTAALQGDMETSRTRWRPRSAGDPVPRWLGCVRTCCIAATF